MISPFSNTQTKVEDGVERLKKPEDVCCQTVFARQGCLAAPMDWQWLGLYAQDSRAGLIHCSLSTWEIHREAVSFLSHSTSDSLRTDDLSKPSKISLLCY